MGVHDEWDLVVGPSNGAFSCESRYCGKLILIPELFDLLGYHSLLPISYRGMVARALRTNLFPCYFAPPAAKCATHLLHPNRYDSNQKRQSLRSAATTIQICPTLAG